MSDERLSEHFWLSELLVSSVADQLGIPNTPTAAHLAVMRTRLAPGLEKVREICGNRAIVVTSAYRNPRINKLVGGTPTSAHPQGYAADITVAARSAESTARLIADAMAAGRIQMDQLILESGRGVVHVAFGPKLRGMRGHQPGGPATFIDWKYFD